MSLNIHHVELFFHVARHGGITAALAHIPYGIQQPAVSLQIGRLEESLGVKLFERRPFALTPAGRELYEFAAPFFSGLDGIAGRLAGDGNEVLRLAASPHVLRQHLPSLLDELAIRPPRLRLTLREANQAGAEAMLRAQEIEMAIVVLETPPPSFIQTEALLSLQTTIVVPAADVAESAAEVLKRARHVPLSLVALPKVYQPSTAVLSEFDRREIAWRLSVEASHVELVDTYVAAGHGIGLSVVIPGREPAANVRHLPLRGFPKVVFGAMWTSRLSEIAARFMEICRKRANSMVG